LFGCQVLCGAVVGATSSQGFLMSYKSRTDRWTDGQTECST